MLLDFSYEKKLQRRGYKIVVGVDEVGRGPLAGPVTAGAVAVGRVLNKRLRLAGLRDSKKLTHARREEFFVVFAKDPGIVWAVSSVYPKVIDRINIYEAVRVASKRAVLSLEKKIGDRAHMVLLDGNATLKLDREQEAIVKGDEKIASCAIASIVAKVTRDRMMMRYHEKYPQYRFDLHKGYGTKLHFAMVKKYGFSPIHRRSFSFAKINGSQR